MESKISRRDLLRAGAVGGAALGTWSLLSSKLVERAFAAGGGCGSLNDIEHIVILIQENRSFDHYFGNYKGVAGFADPNVLALPASEQSATSTTVFGQPGYPGGTDQGYDPSNANLGHLYPFHVDSSKQGDCTNDISHEWDVQHRAWNRGAMDRFVIEHIPPAINGPVNGAMTMGYYTRADLPFYYALADTFTICDQYHCSVIGPTDPNRCYTMSAFIDPAGQHGGPITTTLVSKRLQNYGHFTWTTMPEVLQEQGVSWKVYEAPENLTFVSDNVLPYFKAYQTNPQLAANAFGNVYPGQFQADVAAGTLPQVSWIVAPVVESEHPPAPITWGEAVTAEVLNTLLLNQGVWEKTALFITYDENGGFFDHVAPPTPSSSSTSPEEFLQVAPPAGESGSVGDVIGLGFRVPMLVVSPFSKGGFVCSDTFDHVSTLKFLASRFAAEGVQVPNLVKGGWRDTTVGDLTKAFNFASIDSSKPSLPSPSLAEERVASSSACQHGLESLADENGPGVPTYPVTVNSASQFAAVGQEAPPGSSPKPSGVVPCAA